MPAHLETSALDIEAGIHSFESSGIFACDHLSIHPHDLAAQAKLGVDKRSTAAVNTAQHGDFDEYGGTCVCTYLWAHGEAERREALRKLGLVPLSIAHSVDVDLDRQPFEHG